MRSAFSSYLPPLGLSYRLSRVWSSVSLVMFLLTLALSQQEAFKIRLVELLGSALENHAARTDLTSGGPVTGIIALGGSVARTREAVALSRRFPDAVLVISGPGRQEAIYAKNHAESSDRAIIDHRPTTTYENAWFSRELVRPQKGERWIVVTSAVHMPRALASFRAVDFPVEPWPVYDTSNRQAVLSGAVKHEILGMVYYWLLGRARLVV